MSWIAIALASAALAGVINILDKTVLFRYARSPGTLPLLIALAQGVTGIVLALALWPPAPPLPALGWALASGVLWGLGGLIMLRVLFVQEVSRTIPIYQTFPIFAAILGVLFLEERLSPLLWTAVLATVAGAVLLSVRYEEPYRRLALHRSLFPLMLGSAIAGSAYVAGKIAVADLPVLYTHGVRALGLGGVLLLGSLRPATVREVRVLLREGRWAFAIVGFNEVVLASSSLILALWALSLGPVSLVTALVGTRSLFVVVYGTLLGLRFRGFLGEEVTPGSLAVKFASVALIMLGVGAIGLH